MRYNKQMRSLLKKTLTLLKADRRTPLQISMETGLNFYWVKKLASGEIKEPGVGKIQYLWEYLTKNKLPI